MRAFLWQEAVTHVVMESTGCYGKLVFDALEEAVKVQTPNKKQARFPAQHLGNIGLANSVQIGGLNLFQIAIFSDSVDF